jgi:hypothetical protein
MPPALPPSVDTDAAAIGKLYQRARESHAEGLVAFLECGRLLADKKEHTPHGAWESWLEDNADALGFATPQTARKLMAAWRKWRKEHGGVTAEANRALVHDLDDAAALLISRAMWGNASRRLDRNGAGTPGSTDEDAGAERSASPLERARACYLEVCAHVLELNVEREIDLVTDGLRRLERAAAPPSRRAVSAMRN